MLYRYGVIGHPVKHSLSPLIHRLFAEQTHQTINYKAYDVLPENFQKTIQQFILQKFQGLNVTLPYKEVAYTIATTLTLHAKQAQAVNTLVFEPDGSIIGHNTDGIGLVKDLQRHSTTLTNSRILLLGAGGASRGIIPALLELSPQLLYVVNRNYARAQQLQEDVKTLGSIEIAAWGEELATTFDLIIHATAAGRSDTPLDLPNYHLSAQGGCYDLNYGLAAQPFLNWVAKKQAHWYADGLGMLIEQAAAAFFIWHGIKPSTETVLEYVYHTLGGRKQP